MGIQVSGVGLTLTEALKNTCIDSTEEKLQPLANQTLQATWRLTVEKDTQTAKLSWAYGKFKGNTESFSKDMYKSINSCLKKASEQIKKAHKKVYQSSRSHQKPLIPSDE